QHRNPKQGGPFGDSQGDPVVQQKEDQAGGPQRQDGGSEAASGRAATAKGFRESTPGMADEAVITVLNCKYPEVYGQSLALRIGQDELCPFSTVWLCC
ncbi:MAG: hypothetical protein ACE5H0_12385, partial [Bacteroidota bacterium]